MTLARLSVLDQSPISEGATGGDALRNTLDLARTADRLGYHRYWLPGDHRGGTLGGPPSAGAVRPGARRPVARGADRPGRPGHDAHPRRLRRRDAAALLAVQGHRDVLAAGRAVPG